MVSVAVGCAAALDLPGAGRPEPGSKCITCAGNDSFSSASGDGRLDRCALVADVVGKDSNGLRVPSESSEELVASEGSDVETSCVPDESGGVAVSADCAFRSVGSNAL